MMLSTQEEVRRAKELLSCGENDPSMLIGEMASGSRRTEEGLEVLKVLPTQYHK